MKNIKSRLEFLSEGIYDEYNGEESTPQSIEITNSIDWLLDTLREADDNVDDEDFETIDELREKLNKDIPLHYAEIMECIHYLYKRYSSETNLSYIDFCRQYLGKKEFKNSDEFLAALDIAYEKLK